MNVFSIKKPLMPAVAVVAGAVMSGASALPWLNMPLGTASSAWHLPIDIGWQFRAGLNIGIFNYGLLCMCCACIAFAVAVASWKPFTRRSPMYRAIAHRYGLAGCLCLLPLLLFLLQYLFADLAGINQLAQNRIQLLLIQRHYGYTIAQPIIPLDPLAFDISSIQMRVELLLDQLSIGPLLPIISACILIALQKRSGGGAVSGRPQGTPVPYYEAAGAAVQGRGGDKPRPRLTGWLLLILALLVVCGRAPAAVVCEYQAKALLAQGNYAQALTWLDRAVFLNPELDQMAWYHIERGQALYYVQPGQQNNESQLYLAATYLQQKASLNAYQELLTAWQSHDSASWVRDEMSNLLEKLIENTRPLSNVTGGGFNIIPITPALEQKNDEISLSWLEVLSSVDSGNVYSHYMIGRINYDLHNYAECRAQMLQVTSMSANPDTLSSAYTYLALSDAGQGNYSDERTLLLEAIASDPAYWNNTAREELSGIR